MMWTIFALLLCGIAEAFQKPTEETINPNKKDSLFPVTTSTKVSSNLRDILNQESLVRLSLVQKMQRIAMDALDIKNKVETLTENLKKVTEELRTTKAENQKQQKEIAELKKARENLSVEFRKLKTIQVDESNEMLQLRRDYQNFSIAVNETFKDIRFIQNESNVQLMNITFQVQSEKRIRCESGIRIVYSSDTSYQIQFDTSFEETPSLTLGFVELVSYSRVGAVLSDVTKSGFSISGTQRRCKISWMACGN